MRILVACEFSGVVREAFRKRGHTAYSCDLLPADDNQEWHIQDDIMKVIYPPHRCGAKWDLMIAHPPCTYLSVSGLHWNKRRPERVAETEMAIEFVRALLDAPVGRIALENPVGCISSRIRKPDQIIQPYEFGHDASKATCLWLKGLPKLKPTSRVEPRLVNGRRIWGNQTPSGQNKLGPSSDRWKLRSITYQGIEDAMAEQWDTNEA